MVDAKQTPGGQDVAVVLPAKSTPVPPVPALRSTQPETVPKRRLWLWGAAGVLCIALGLLPYSQLWVTRPQAVVVEIAAFAPATRVLAVNGRIAAVDSAEIRSVVSGTLIALPVAEGDLVAVDQILAQVDPAAQNAIVRQAVAGLDAALVAQQQAQEDFDRAASLGDNVARTVLETNAHTVQSAAQEVARQTAALDQVRVVLENHTVRSPIAGNVETLDVELGQIVGPTTPLLTLADLSNLIVKADVDEAYATQIAVNQPAVLLLAGETRNRDGHVSFVSTRVDISTGGLAIKVAFDANVRAPIGLTVATNIIIDQRDAALTIPRTAILTDAGITSVFVVQDGIARRKTLTVVD